ncbi:uncharacterized protein LOC124275703 isoform X1 [Haliotis rubra]|uniref:uncharacterized protein LOC124275703 isoform X1 n=1 Tax=Haliotis rubra TaxID=36100 RepID=UPI001EE52C2F|nr:uncharacterized protein LOC124275703 isoform X1 [Haliotis rubra]
MNRRNQRRKHRYMGRHRKVTPKYRSGKTKKVSWWERCVRKFNKKPKAFNVTFMKQNPELKKAKSRGNSRLRRYVGEDEDDLLEEEDEDPLADE